MRSLTYMIALLVTTIIVGCTSPGSDVRQQAVVESGNVSVPEHQSDQSALTRVPAVTSTIQATATKAEVASPPSSQPLAATQGSTSAPAPTPSATVTLTPVPTAAPTASATPGSAGPAKKTIADSAELAERGISVYQEQYCGICHQLDAAGTAGLFGPTHNGFAQVAEQRLRDPHYSGTATTAGEYVRESILRPELYLVGGYEHSSHHMPAYVNLSNADLEALIQLLLQQE